MEGYEGEKKANLTSKINKKRYEETGTKLGSWSR
jgi:hypothetical protein